MANITSANSTLVLSSADYALNATSIEGYMVDSSSVFDEAVSAEVIMGVDGKASSGWVPRLIIQTISLQADSASRDLFEDLVALQDSQRTIFKLNGVLTYPGIRKTCTLVNGVLTAYTSFPVGKRVLDGTPYKITWESALITRY